MQLARDEPRSENDDDTAYRTRHYAGNRQLGTKSQGHSKSFELGREYRSDERWAAGCRVSLDYALINEWLGSYIASMDIVGPGKPPPAARRSGVQVISRAATILNLLARSPAGLTLAEVVKRSGLAKSTAYRILLALEEEQLVESYDNRYRVGRILARSAMAETEQVRLRARPFLERLAVELHETVDITVLVGDQIMIIEQIFWMRELTAGRMVGSMLPAARTASGLALLACSPSYAEYAAAAPAFEARATGTGEALEARLAKVRKDGIAVDSVGLEGVSATAIFAVDDVGNAFALGVPVPTVRFAPQADRIRATLLEARPEFERIVRGH
jgi:DNA-binding IclR family transcriptional regulator